VAPITDPLTVAPRVALAAGRPALVWRRQVADTETPVAAALRLMEPGRGDFLLESVEGGAIRGRYSWIGLAPDLVFRAQGNAAAINRCWTTDAEAWEPCAAPTLDASLTLRPAQAEPHPPAQPLLALTVQRHPAEPVVAGEIFGREPPERTRDRT